MPGLATRLAARIRHLLVVAVAVWSLPGQATVLNLDGAPGRYGAPYAYLGPAGARVWENYRKHVDGIGSGAPSASVVALGDPQRVRYSDLRMSTTNGPTAGLYVAPGLFVGAQQSLASYPEGQLSLVESLHAGARQGFDVRFGFLEHRGQGGGAPLDQLIVNNGGEDGGMDLYQPYWGVDGLYLRLELHNDAAVWTFTSLIMANLAAASSASWEDGRKNYDPQVVITGASRIAGSYVTAIDSNTPLTLGWQIVQSGSSSSLEVLLGGAVRLQWLFDDGVSRFGLTSPGNPDGVGYQGGALDLSALTPALFVGSTYYEAGAALEGTTMDLEVTGTAPVVTGFPSPWQVGAPGDFLVTARRSTGAVDTAWTGTVVFSATDPSALLPAAYTFTLADQGIHDFQATFAESGIHDLVAGPTDLPALGVAQTDIVVAEDPNAARASVLRIECGCGSASGPPWGLGWSLALLGLRRARAGQRCRKR